MTKLRDKETGCPWDQAQNFESIARYAIEEAYEVNDAIINKNWENLKEELGDLLLQIVFQSQIADEQKLFNFDDVVEGISKKMTDRHPHVFKNESNKKSIEQQIIDWENIKQSEKRQLDGSIINQQPNPVWNVFSIGLLYLGKPFRLYLFMIKH